MIVSLEIFRFHGVQSLVNPNGSSANGVAVGATQAALSIPEPAGNLLGFTPSPGFRVQLRRKSHESLELLLLACFLLLLYICITNVARPHLAHPEMNSKHRPSVPVGQLCGTRWSQSYW